MINEELHKLFHDLGGAINGMHMMAQIGSKYVTTFNLEKLKGKFEGEITSNFKNIMPYYEKTLELLKLIVGALAKIDSKDIGASLENDIMLRMKEIKETVDKAEASYNTLLQSDTKENLLQFAKELDKIEPLCNSMGKLLNSTKEKLTDQGKY